MSSVASRGGAHADRPRTARARSRRIRQWIPPQHGVWAMLLLPYLAGLRYGLDWLQVPLLIGWLTGWLMSHHALLVVKTGRWRRVAPQVLAYGTVSATTLLPVLALRPALIWFAPAFAALLAVNVAYVRWSSERAILNGLASVTMAAQMAMIVPVAAGGDWREGITVAAVTWLYLAGTVFYVKTMIREHGSLRHRRLSVGYHVAALALAVWIHPWLAIPFTLMLVRAFILPTRPRMKAPVIGAVEVVLTLVLLGFLLALAL